MNLKKKTSEKKKLIRFSVAYDILFHTVDSLSKCHPSYTIIRGFFISYFVHKECTCTSFVCWFQLQLTGDTAHSLVARITHEVGSLDIDFFKPEKKITLKYYTRFFFIDILFKI